MAATRDTRISRGYSFTFDEEGEKELYHAYAKRRGTNLANLIKMLLAADLAAHPAPATGPPLLP